KGRFSPPSSACSTLWDHSSRKRFRRLLLLSGCPSRRATSGSRRGDRMNVVYFVHFVYMWKSEKFTAYPYETKDPVYFVHFSQRFFSRGARRLPNRTSRKDGAQVQLSRFAHPATGKTALPGDPG